jgi:hypothetical protein
VSQHHGVRGRILFAQRTRLRIRLLNCALMAVGAIDITRRKTPPLPIVTNRNILVNPLSPPPPPEPVIYGWADRLIG